MNRPDVANIAYLRRIYDSEPGPRLLIHPGGLPPDVDPPVVIPDRLPITTPPVQQERFSHTPIYDSLTYYPEYLGSFFYMLTAFRTNVPDVAMCFSDMRFAYGPFAPHYVPRQYIESYFSFHKTDSFLVLSTTVEDVSKLSPLSRGGWERWLLTLRRRDAVRQTDFWWQETFDAVIFANGHYSVPYVREVYTNTPCLTSLR